MGAARAGWGSLPPGGILDRGSGAPRRQLGADRGTRWERPLVIFWASGPRASPAPRRSPQPPPLGTRAPLPLVRSRAVQFQPDWPHCGGEAHLLVLGGRVPPHAPHLPLARLAWVPQPARSSSFVPFVKSQNTCSARRVSVAGDNRSSTCPKPRGFYVCGFYFLFFLAEFKRIPSFVKCSIRPSSLCSLGIIYLQELILKKSKDV